MDPQIRLTDENLPSYLEKLGLFTRGEKVIVETAGDGNINWVRRVRLVSAPKSWVVKQARPALERFPEYQVTPERIQFEHRYFETVRPLDPSGVCPEIHHFDPEARVLVLEDLGDVPRLDQCSPGSPEASHAAEVLGRFLGRVHAATRDPALAAEFENPEMKRLHGEHIFQLPFRPNDFPLPPGVAGEAERIWKDATLRARADAAYERYLEPQGALVHGDVQGGNVLLAHGLPRLIDAEIAHVGDPAFDLGMLVAHLMLAALAQGTVGAGLPAVGIAWSAYSDAHGTEHLSAFESAAGYAGLELIRRTIGAARIPAASDPERALRLLDAGERWLRDPPSSPEGLAASLPQ